MWVFTYSEQSVQSMQLLSQNWHTQNLWNISATNIWKTWHQPKHMPFWIWWIFHTPKATSHSTAVAVSIQEVEEKTEWYFVPLISRPWWQRAICSWCCFWSWADFEAEIGEQPTQLLTDVQFLMHKLTTNVPKRSSVTSFAIKTMECYVAFLNLTKLLWQEIS